MINDAKNLVLVKNEGDLLQQFIWDAENFKTPETQAPGKPVEKEEARQHGAQVADGLKTLGTLLVTNGQFRKLREYSFSIEEETRISMLIAPQ